MQYYALAITLFALNVSSRSLISPFVAAQANRESRSLIRNQAVLFRTLTLGRPAEFFMRTKLESIVRRGGDRDIKSARRGRGTSAERERGKGKKSPIVVYRWIFRSRAIFVPIIYLPSINVSSCCEKIYRSVPVEFRLLISSSVCLFIDGSGFMRYRLFPWLSVCLVMDLSIYLFICLFTCFYRNQLIYFLRVYYYFIYLSIYSQQKLFYSGKIISVRYNRRSILLH